MKRLRTAIWIIVAAAGSAAAATEPQETQHGAPAAITIDYPAEGSIFPPDLTAPRFIWHDAAETAANWLIEVTFADGSAGIRAESQGEHPRVGEIDPRCIDPSNKPPELTPEEAAARTWTPDAETWETIKQHSVAGPATVTIVGLRDKDPDHPVSRGRLTIHTSKDPVGAPIFYRDVPLMPGEMKKGVIQPLPQSKLPLVAWRLRNVAEPKSRLLLTDLYTCANCHSFSRDGKTLGMDVDGPQNDKGTYALATITPEMSIQTKDIITWNSFPGKPPGLNTIGFMAQVSPDGRYAVVTLNEVVYVANFKDYRFLQVFYPTRGILAWYDRVTGSMKALPGADDPHYVQTGGFWSPDGKYLVFARAEAMESYPEGRKLAAYANDPNEIPMQYDLYRIPFNEGKGGRPEPIAGASKNGMSNNFPKVSPDGRWIVFVQCRNGQLMRPDSQLYIVPAQGGQARRMRCNTPLMNSWHSFSPNGRWLVFSSKSRSPYTQMFLTHLDEEGRDSPAILIENSTAANRAVNIPEFVNIPSDGLKLLSMDVPAAKVYRHLDLGVAASERGQYELATAELKKALEIDPEYPDAHNNLGIVLGEQGRLAEAIAEYRTTLKIKPDHAKARVNLGVALMKQQKYAEAMAEYRKAMQIEPDYADAYSNLGVALYEQKRVAEAIVQYRKAVELKPLYAQAHFNLANALLAQAKYDEAIAEHQQALEAKPDHAEARYNLGVILYHRGRIPEAIAQWAEMVRLQPENTLALSRLARGLATSPEAAVRNGRKAVELAQQAAKLTGSRDPMVLDTLAAAYAETGQFAEAVQTAQQALALASSQNNAALADALRARIKLYQGGSPYRDIPSLVAPRSGRP